MVGHRASDALMDPILSYSFQLVGTGAFLYVARFTGAQLMIFVCFNFSVVLFDISGI